MANKQDEDYKSLSNELEDIIAKLQSDGISVDEALKSYERGMEIIENLQSQIKDAENKVKRIKAKFDSK